jgi:serine/threonine-protein kinase CHEK2
VSLESVFYDSPEGFMAQKIHRQSYPVIVMETVTGGCLIDRLANETLRASMSESTIANMFRTAVNAVDSIHKRGFIHRCVLRQLNLYWTQRVYRDLKLDNLLLATDDDNSPVKVIDFGLMVQLDYNSNEYIQPHERGHPVCKGTPGMYAPESIDHSHYSTASDVWQLGCIVYRSAHICYCC